MTKQTIFNNYCQLFCYWIKFIKFAEMKLKIPYCHFDDRRKEKSIYAIFEILHSVQYDIEEEYLLISK